MGTEQLRIYVSLVSNDLKEYQEAVYQTLHKLGYEAVTIGDFVIDGRASLKRCLDEVASCDIYLGIFAWRYGYIPDKSNPERKSLAELEYRQAGAAGMPRLIFLLDPKTPWSPSVMDAITGESERGQRIAVLRAELAKEQVVSFFTNPRDLSDLISVSVTRAAGTIAHQRATERAKQEAQKLAARLQRIPSPPPPLPMNFVARPEALQRLRNVILRSGNHRPVALTALAGLRGIGRSVLAAALCQDQQIVDAFPDGIIWLTLGRAPGNLVSQMVQVGHALGDSDEHYYTPESGRNRLRTLLQDKAILLVLDDVWHGQHVEPFHTEAPRCSTLVTTRDPEVARSLNAIEINLELLDPEQAVQLLSEWSEKNDPAFPDIAERLGYLPLTVKLAGAQLRNGMTGGEWLTTFENRLAQFNPKQVPDSQDNLQVCFALSLEHLSETSRFLYYTLGIFPEDTPILQAVIFRLWQRIQPELTATQCSNLLSELALCGLIEYNTATETVSLHDLLYDYSREKLGEHATTIHGDLLAAYNPDNLSWASIVHDGYLYHHLAYHLREANQEEILRHLLFDFAWLQAKLEATNVNALLNDYEFLPNDPDLRFVQGALRLSAQTVAQDKTQLRSQLYGRLLALQVPAIETLVQRLKEQGNERWLRLLVPTLTPPGDSLLRTLRGHNHWVSAVAITPDGKQFVSASDDQTLKVWDLQSGQELHTLRGHSNEVTAVALTPDGTQVVSASDDQTLKVWDLQSGQELHTLRGHTDWVSAVAITPDGQQVVSASVDQTLKVWDLRTGRELRTLRGHRHRVNAVAIAPEGTQVVSASVDQTLKVWDLRTGRELRTLRGHRHRVNAVAITPDGKQVVSASGDQTLKVWDLRTGQELRTLRGHTDWVNAVAITPDGQQVVSASIDQTLKVWDLRTGQELHTLRGHSYRVNTVAITPDGTQALSASADQTFKVWDLRTGQESFTLRGHSHRVSAVAITPDGTQALSASADQTFKVWDLHTGQELRTLRDHSQWVRSLAITPDGQQVVSTAADQTLKVWDLNTGQEFHTLKGHRHRISAVAITPDGTQAVSVSDDQTLKVWDLHTGQELHTLRGHTHWVSAVAITPDGQQAVSASADQTLKVWDLVSGQELRTLHGHTHWVRDVAITPDGQMLVSASVDQTLKVWDFHSGQILTTFSADAPILTCAVAPNGVTMVAGDSAGKVHFLRLEGGPKSKG